MSARAATLLTALGAFAGLALAACSDGAENERWLVERLVPFEPTADVLRVSRDNVSRALWVGGVQEGVELRAAPGGVLELELARAPGHAEAAPRTVEARFERSGESVGIPAAALPAPVQARGAHWHRYRASLDDAPAGTGTLRVFVDGAPAGPASGWLVAGPRLYRRVESNGAPNVLLVTIDTLRADVLGCYGYDRDTSPELDALALRSFVFERAVSQASWTLPSYASILTGLYSESHGVIHRNHALEGAQVSFVELFARAGYTTAAFVSGTFTDSYWGFDQGFDLYDDLGMVTDDNAEAEDDPTQPGTMRAKAHRRITSVEVTDKAIAWLEENRERRFFLVAHYFDPHGDYLEHPGFSERFTPRPVPDRMPLHGGRVPPERDRERALYEGEVAFTDHHVGRLLDRLAELGLREETIVVVFADHGEEFAERMKVGHGHGLFNELLHVPLILRVPGRDGGRVASVVGNVDIGPTLLELCGLDVSALRAQGVSLVPLLDDTTLARREPVLSSHFAHVSEPEAGDGQLGYRVDRGERTYLQQAFPRGVGRFVFDWADPGQTRDLLGGDPAAAGDLEGYYRERRAALDGRRIHAATVDLRQGDVLERLRALGYGGGR